MPKIKVKPTPTQARILRTLNETPLLFIGRVGHATWWTGTDDNRITRELGKPREVTVKKLITEGWIMPVVDQDIYWMITPIGQAAIDVLTTDDFTSKPPDITAREIITILKAEVFPPPFWMMVEELALSGRRVDAFALKVATHVNILSSAFTQGITGARLLTSWSLEIKVSRSDFLSDIADIRKQDRAREICNRFAYVAPVGLIQKEELPPGCGLLEIYGNRATNRRVKMTVEPDYEIAEPASWSLVAAIARAMMK